MVELARPSLGHIELSPGQQIAEYQRRLEQIKAAKRSGPLFGDGGDGSAEGGASPPVVGSKAGAHLKWLVPRSHPHATDAEVVEGLGGAATLEYIAKLRQRPTMGGVLRPRLPLAQDLPPPPTAVPCAVRVAQAGGWTEAESGCVTW